MKQYIYSSREVGLEAWPSGELRLEGIEITANPDEAGVFVLPGNLSIFKDDLGRLDGLPFISGREDRLVCFDVSDNFTKALCRKWIIIRCDARDWMLKDDPNVIPFAWPVECYLSCVDVPEGGFVYNLSFQGWLSSPARLESSRACRKNPQLKTDVAGYTDFTGYLHDRTTGQWTAEGLRRRAEFRRSMKESRIALCPESIPGVLPYRFFEAMSAGRVPLLVSSDYVLPFADRIPYSEFVIFAERDQAANADHIVLDFVRSHGDDEIVQMGLKARKYWELWLDCRDWPRMMGLAVREKLRELACVSPSYY